MLPLCVFTVIIRLRIIGHIMNKIITGDTAGFTFSILYSGAVDGQDTPDLTQCNVVFAVKRNKTDPDTKVIVTKTIAHPDTNIVYFELTPEETAKMAVGVYSACCKLYYESGTALTVWMDDLTVVKGVLGARQ